MTSSTTAAPAAPAGGSGGENKEERYEGLWLEDMRHGWGQQKCANGDVMEGEWYQDKPKDGEWKITYASRDEFVGTYSASPHK